MTPPDPLMVTHEHPRTKRTIRDEAEFLAREIQEDVMAKEAEIADAIEGAITRYARDCYRTPAKGEPPRKDHFR